MRKFTIAAGIALLMTVAIPSAANADDASYPPAPPSGSTLAGSVAVGTCDGDVPWIDFDLTRTGSDVGGDSAELVLSDGSNSTTIPLGVLEDNALSGRVMWPGASVDAQGNAVGWPGWELVNGQWAETSGNFAWTRGQISAVIKVNPELVVPLSFPDSTPVCATSPRIAGQPASGSTLPATGMSDAVLPIGIVGGAVVLVGFGLVAARRHARR